MNNLDVVIIYFSVTYLASLYSMLGSVLVLENMVDKILSFPSIDSNWTERTFWNHLWELYALNIPYCSLFSEYLKIHSLICNSAHVFTHLDFWASTCFFSQITVSMQTFKSQIRNLSKNFLSFAFCSTLTAMPIPRGHGLLDKLSSNKQKRNYWEGKSFRSIAKHVLLMVMWTADC